MGESEVTSCYRHEDRRSGVVCQRCDRPICSECMNQADVGFHCPECLRRGQQQVIRGPVAFDPIVTKVLIGLNVVISAAALVAGGSLGALSNSVLNDFSLWGPQIDVNGESWRIFSSAFLHGGVIHLGFNMWALWVLGPSLERLLGPVRFAGLYLVSLLGGAFGVLLLDPNVRTIGASGAVFGLFGAVAVLQRAAGVNLWESGLGVVLGLNLLITFAVPQISIGGHLGGLIAGAALMMALVPIVRQRGPEWIAPLVIGLMAIAYAGGSLWAAAQWADPLF